MQTLPDATHLRPDLWPRVDDFLPERFLVDKDDPLYPPKNAWRAFELGTTRCIGEELAMMEMKLALVLTIREFDFEFDWSGWHKLQCVKEPFSVSSGLPPAFSDANCSLTRVTGSARDLLRHLKATTCTVLGTAWVLSRIICRHV